MNKELQRIADNIANYDAKEWDISKEDLQADYDRFKDIPDSLQIHEMRLIWYLRNLRIGETRRFLALAKSNYEITQATIGLRYPEEVNKCTATTFTTC